MIFSNTKGSLWFDNLRVSNIEELFEFELIWQKTQRFRNVTMVEGSKMLLWSSVYSDNGLLLADGHMVIRVNVLKISLESRYKWMKRSIL